MNAIPLTEFFSKDVCLDAGLAQLKRLKPDAPEKAFDSLFGDIVPPVVRALGCPDLLPALEKNSTVRAEAVRILYHAQTEKDAKDQVLALEDFLRHAAIEAYLA